MQQNIPSRKIHWPIERLDASLLDMFTSYLYVCASAKLAKSWKASAVHVIDSANGTGFLLEATVR